MSNQRNQYSTSNDYPDVIISAVEIVADYSGTMKETEHMMFGAPESLLPHSREKIREAIRVLMLFLSNEERWDTVRQSHPDVAELVLTNRYFNALKAAYMRLARFLPDTDAALAERANALFREADQYNLRELCTPWYKRARDLQRLQNEEALTLLIELENEFGNKMPGS